METSKITKDGKKLKVMLGRQKVRYTIKQMETNSY